MDYVLFLAGFFLLIKGAGWLIDGATSFAEKYSIPHVVIGLTIVAFGSSAPEFAVNVIASVQKNSALAFGNIVGSNIVNVAFILGVVSILYPLSVQKDTLKNEIPLVILTSLILFSMANDQFLDGASGNIISRIDGIILIGFFLIFLRYIRHISKNSTNSSDEEYKILPLWQSLLYIFIGLGGLILGGDWIVGGAVAIARFFGIPESVIGLTIVAVGTSLPELAASTVAALKKNSDIAIGNIVGSVLFNMLWVLGITTIIYPMELKAENNVDLMVMTALGILLFVFIFGNAKKMLLRIHGVFFLIIYFAYNLYLILNVAKG